MPTTRYFGIVSNVEGLSAGITVNGMDFNDSAEIAQARNQRGEVIDLAAYSNAKSVSVSGVMDSAKGTLATAGSKLTLQGKDWIIQSVQKQESNTAFVTVTLSCRTADNAIITIIDGSSSGSSESSSSL